MNTRLQWPLLVSFSLTVGLEILSAVITALHPYHDYPMVPRLIFIYLLWPGWTVGFPYPRHWWDVLAGVVITAFYAAALLGLTAICTKLHTRLARRARG